MMNILNSVIALLLIPVLSQAEPTYSEKIDLEYEFYQLEDELISLKPQYEDQLSDYQDAIEIFKDSKKPIRYLLGYILNHIDQPDVKEEFATVINNSKNLIYLSIAYKVGMGLGQTAYYKMEDTECISLIPIDQIQDGYILVLNNSRFETIKRYGSFDDYFMEFLYKFPPNNETEVRVLYGQVITEGRVFSELRSYQQMGSTLAKYYSCDFVNAFKIFEKEYMKKLNRYKEIGQILELKMDPRFDEQK